MRLVWWVERDAGRTEVGGVDAVGDVIEAVGLQHEVLLAAPLGRVGHVRGVKGHVPARKRVLEVVDAFGRRLDEL